MKAKLLASLLMGTCLAVGVGGVASAMIQPAGSEISNRDLHNYAEMFNRGLVNNPAEYNSLHPFVRANWSSLQRGEIPMAGVGASTRTGAVKTNEISYRADGAKDLWEFSRWLQGGSLPSKLSGAPAAVSRNLRAGQGELFKARTAALLDQPVTQWQSIIIGDIKSLIQERAGGRSTASQDVRDIFGQIQGALAGREGRLPVNKSKDERSLSSVKCYGNGTLRCFAGPIGMTMKYTEGNRVFGVAVTQEAAGGIRGSAVIKERDPALGWKTIKKAVGPMGGLDELMSQP